MSLNLKPKYSASLTFRGFEMTPEEVETLVGVKSTMLGLRDTPIKPNTRPLKRSSVKYEISFDESTHLFEMIPSLFSIVGGVEHLAKLREIISPEYLEVDITLRIKQSEEQEGGFIDSSTLEDLSRLQCTLSFQFLDSE